MTRALSPVVVLVGVSGSGKTTVGERLAAALGWPFHDGDDYHPRANVEKMRSGRPLDDEDRKPWLRRLREVAGEAAAGPGGAVIACSALKRSYRRYLQCGRPSLRYVYLTGSVPLLRRRLAERRGHYMAAGMLDSQLAALEEPRGVLTVDVTPPPEQIVARIRAELGL